MSEMATLAFQNSETVLQQLFSRDTPGFFTPGPLALFVVVFYACAVL